MNPIENSIALPPVESGLPPAPGSARGPVESGTIPARGRSIGPKG